MKVHSDMKHSRIKPQWRRPLGAALLAAAAVLSAGCASTELASFDDVHVPDSVGENYPIKVAERPVKLTFDAAPGGLRPSDFDQVTSFAQQASSRANTPVTVAYAARSKPAHLAANQAAQVLARQGVARPSILVTPQDSPGNVVTLAFGTKVAETKPCGDFSENLRGNQRNLSGPNFGCAFQQNVAAMIANPSDLQHRRAETPAYSAAQSKILDAYYAGTWLEPIEDSSNSGSGN